MWDEVSQLHDYHADVAVAMNGIAGDTEQARTHFEQRGNDIRPRRPAQARQERLSLSARHQPGDPFRVQRRADCIWLAPENPRIAVGVVHYALLGNLVRRWVIEASTKHEDHLVLVPAPPLEQVFRDTQETHISDTLADLLDELPPDRIGGILTELDMTTKHPVERRGFGTGVFRHQQGPISRSPDHRHRLDHLPAFVH
jgi:hypothetical protein